jgi:hypothetical protein
MALLSTTNEIPLTHLKGGPVGTVPTMQASGDIEWNPVTAGQPTQDAVALVNGLNSNVEGTGKSSLLFNGWTGAVSFGGLDPASVGAGGTIEMTFLVSKFPITIVNQDAGSLAANRITTPTGQNVLLPPGQAPTCRLVRNGSAGWILQTGAVTSVTTAKITDFGADPTGTTDSTVAIQDALAFLAASGGGELDCPPGIYHVSAELSITVPAIHVRGHGNPAFSGGTVFVAIAPMRSILNVNAGNARVENLGLSANLKANHGLLRNGENFSEYNAVAVTNAIFDGFHAAATNATLTPIAQVGPGPVVTTSVSPGSSPLLTTVTATVTITTAGPLGTAQATIDIIGDGGGTSPPVVIPLDGLVQFQTGVSTSAFGLLWAFAPGNYELATTYSTTTGAFYCVNDSSIFRNCQANTCGFIYGSNAAIDMLGALQYGIFEWNRGAPHLTGTCTTIAESVFIDGIGTNFLTSQARWGDFVRFGFPQWTALTTYKSAFALGSVTLAASNTIATGTDQSANVSTGSFVLFAAQAGVYYQVESVSAADIVLTTPYTGPIPGGGGASTATTSSFVTAGPNSAPPGQAYAWICTVAGESGATAPAWPITSGPNFLPPIGATVTDGTATWTCYMHTAYQIVNNQDNTRLVVGSGNAPLQSFAGLDYAICVGHGCFDELSNNTSITLWEGGLFEGCAASGISCNPLFGNVINATESVGNGIAGYVAGYPGGIIEGIVYTKPYCEANYVCDVWVASVQGFAWIMPTWGLVNAQVYNPGGNNNAGLVMGNPGNGGLQIQPIGSGYSSMPSIASEGGQAFRIASTLSYNGTAIFLNPTIAIESDFSIVAIAAFAGPLQMTAQPAIAPGNYGVQLYGNLLTLYNDYLYPITILDDSVAPGGSGVVTQSGVNVIIPPGSGVNFVWISGLWRQVSTGPDSPLLVQSVVQPLTNAPVVLTSLQYACSVIALTGVLTGPVTVTFPNQLGAWDIDVSGLSGISVGNTLTFASGSASGPAISALLPTKTLLRVVTRGTNTIAVSA